MVTVAVSTWGRTGAGSGATAFGFTVTTGAPWLTAALTCQFPANTDWVVVPSAATSVASVISPEPSFTASRPATSRPSAVELSRIAAGSAAAAI
jgi:hypothetical protein